LKKKLSEINLYIVLLVLVVIYLNTSFKMNIASFSNKGRNNLFIIEQLTVHSSKPKNYRRAAASYKAFGYQVSGNMDAKNEIAKLNFSFPFVGHREVTFTTELNTLSTSKIVSGFGAHNSCFAPVNDQYFALQTTDENFLRQNMNQDGFFFRSSNRYDYGVNYNEIMRLSKDLSKEIASFIVKELGDQDSHDNRVMAALNFVQYIPYGQPQFDAGEYTYFGVALPHESFAISYSDCDSKSVMLCGILRELIEDSEKNIILVYCTMEEEHHMIVGVHGVRFPGKTHFHKGRSYLLLETTTPISLEQQQTIDFQNIHVYELTNNA
jgi:hypothetical protein